MEVNQGNDLNTEKELRKKRLEELKRKRELKKAAMQNLSSGVGAVSAGPATFAKNVSSAAPKTVNVSSLPPQPPQVEPVRAPLPKARPVRKTPERRMPSAKGQTLETPISRLGTSKVKPKYSLVSGEPTSRVSPRKASKTSKRNQKDKYLMYIERGAWAFCLFLFVRLVFADRGIVDYYQRKGDLSGRQGDYLMISDDNQGLIKEISLLKKSKTYQKKTIREHLGFIARDEYLVLVE